MGTTGIVFDKVFKDHDTGPGHPETAERIDHIGNALEKSGLWDDLEKIGLREATREEITRVHTERHVDNIAATDGKDRTYMDGDTPTSSLSYKTALIAAGSLLSAVDRVMDGSVKNAFAFIRPPGHHAESDKAMGFCLFNNVAIAAEHLKAVHGLKRVLIVDWDVHHGNATQHSFYKDPSVLYFSTHRYPFYPGTGGVDETGSGEGKGYNINLPMPAGMNDGTYDAIFKKVLEPVARDYKPEFILVSAGFDTHERDPLGGMDITSEGFARMTGILKGLAEELCKGRLAVTLEGGYSLGGQAESVVEVLSVMSGKKEAPSGDLEPQEIYHRLVEKLKEYLGDKWPQIGS